MYGEYAYGVDDSAREHLVPNLRIVASQPFIGLTAYLGDEPHLVIGKEGEDSYLMEDQFGHVKVVDFVFPWEMPKVESNRLVAASRIADSPFRDVGFLCYDEETGEWAVRVGSSNMRYPLEDKVASLEEQGWSKHADIAAPSGVDLGGDFGHGHSGPSHGEHPGAGELAPTIEVRAACPHCHSDQHLELMQDDEGHPHSDSEKTYACHNCGKWALEHELEVSDHDKDGQDKNPEDVDYEEHDDDAERHQDDHDDVHEVHDKTEEHELDDKEPRPRKKSSTAFTVQGVTFNEQKSAKGVAIKPEEQGSEQALQMMNTLPTAFQHEQEYVKNRYKELGLAPNYKYDNPFVNRGGSFDKEAIGTQNLGPGEVGELPEFGRQPSQPEHFSPEQAILCVNELTPDDFKLFANKAVSGILLSRGGPGSHAVYVATTMGLSCVLIKPEEMARIQIGDQLQVDGRTGVVHVNGGTADFQVRTQDEVRNEAETDEYRFAYAGGHGFVEKMIPGQMTGELGGHQGMIGLLMGNGHAQMEAVNGDYNNIQHNIAFGFFTNKGTIIQDLNQIPDQEQFLNWAHAEESGLGLPRGEVKREDISAYGAETGGGAAAPAPATPAAPAPTPDVSEPEQAVAAVTGEETPSGGPKHEKANTCPNCGSHTIEALNKDDATGDAEWLCLSCDNTFKAPFRRTAAGKHPNGTRVQIVHPTMKGQKGSITEHAGTDESFGDDLYHILLDNGDELKKVPEVHFTKIKSASIEKTAAQFKAYLPNNAWHNGVNNMAEKLGLTGSIHYPLTGATLPVSGAGMPHLFQTFQPEHASLGGNNNIPIDVDVNDPDLFWQIWDAPQEGGGSGEKRLREEEAAHHHEEPQQQSLLGKVSNADYLVVEDEDGNVLHAAMLKGAPYPEKSYHNAPDHSPKGQDWPAEVNAVYNACMREGEGDKSKCAAIAWAQYHKSEKAHGHGTTEEEGKKKEGDYQPNLNPAGLPGQQAQTPPCPHCGSPTVGTPQAYSCPSCGYQYPEQQQAATPAAPGTAPMAQPSNPNFHSHVKSAALSVGEWYTMYSPDYKVPDVIQVVTVDDQGVTANIEGDDKGLFPITLPHEEIEKAGYKFEPYSNPSEVKTARRSFTVAEQNDLVNENLEGQARNYHKLNLEGTHYTQEVEASIDPLNEEFWLW